MNFDFTKNNIKRYVKLLEKRTNKVREKYVEILSYNLYELSPKLTGALASNYNISVNVINDYWDPNKVTPDFKIPNFRIKDQVFIVNTCPYIGYVNYGTSKQVAQNFIQAAEFKSNVELNQYISIIGNTDY